MAAGAENEAVEQIAFADRLILNKIDVVPDEADLKRIEERIRGINQFAPIVRAERSKVSVNSVLNIGAFDLKRTLEMDPTFLGTEGDGHNHGHHHHVHHHVHDRSVSSVGIRVDESVDLQAVQSWMSDLLSTRGADMYRMKGVLSVAHADERFVFQAVHMMFDGNFMEPWGDNEKRGCKLTFIGKNLNEKELKEEFTSCLCTEEENAKRRNRLRFKIGDRVECNTGTRTWPKGEVVDLMYHDDSMEAGMVAPYQVQLDNGNLIYAPADEPNVIRQCS